MRSFNGKQNLSTFNIDFNNSPFSAIKHVQGEIPMSVTCTRIDLLLKMNEKLQILWLVSMLVAVAHGAYAPWGERVCLVGAGVAGIVSTNKLLQSPKPFDIVVFEKNADVGGQWIYTDRTHLDERGYPVTSNIYKYMRANGPKPFQTFPDYPEFYGEERSYVRHETMLQYLRNYTDHFGLRRFMRFNTWVETVISQPHDKWLIQLRDIFSNQRYFVRCDAVMIGTGNFHAPNIPEIKGIESFPGRVMHSRAFRYPEIFADQTVVVLGASFSGIDIGIQISQFARKVYLSHRHEKMKIELPSNIEQVTGVVAAEGNEFILSDGSRVRADAILLATGYLYDYPVLDRSAGISVVQGKYVRPLYKHMINVEHPTMAIMGLPHPGYPFLIPYAQAQYFVALLEGRAKLPSRSEMMKDSELPKGVSPSKAHYFLLDKTFPYYNDLAKAAGAQPIPDSLKIPALYYKDDLENHPLHFRDRDWYIYANGTFALFDRRQRQTFLIPY